MLGRGKMVSLFDGIGCFPLAYANITKRDYKSFEYYSSEKEQYLIDILNENFKNVKHLGLVEDIDVENLKHQNIEVITMGTPCTGFSLSGKRDGLENIESRLFSDGVDVIEKVKPKYFIWENVFGVLSNNKGNDFRFALEAFAKAGYNLVWTTYDSKYFGVPQKRRRVYLIGVRNDLKQGKMLSYIDPFHFEHRRTNFLLKENKAAIDNLYKNNHSVKDGVDVYYFNRQRSDLFKEEGVASTLAKRDYKSFKDLIAYNGIIRRETPRERLRLQGMPDDWFDGVLSKYKDNTLYRANGMTLPVVESVFRTLDEIDNYEFLKSASEKEKNQGRDDMLSMVVGNKKSSHQLVDSLLKLKSYGKDLGRIYYSGLIEWDDNTQKYSVVMFDDCLECDYEINVDSPKTIADIIDFDVDKKYELTEKSKEGILRRERESGKLLPEKLKEMIKK